MLKEYVDWIFLFRDCDCLRVPVKILDLMLGAEVKSSGNFLFGYATVSLSVSCLFCETTVTKELGNIFHAFLPK